MLQYSALTPVDKPISAVVDFFIFYIIDCMSYVKRTGR
jgi:hypothetical protein